MNFDDIQSLWNADDGGKDMVVPDNVEKIKSAHHPVVKIRKAMKREGWVQLASIIILAFAPMYFKSDILTVAYYCLYGVMLALSGYYFYRFYLFYRRLGTAVLSAKEHLYEVYYDIQLHIEMYRSFSYGLMMLALGFVTMYVLTVPGSLHAAIGNDFRGTTVIKTVFIFVVFIGGIVVSTEMWIKRCYGMYLKEIKKIKDELKENI
ncbi:hypothetical protein HGH92_15330 [Chitinophaga varians]|uniref:Uncharacterized protein n=1 Tax=Chitinophaga varians TaxID=2202339 RepID=A0A847RXA7_9BACT|nr:hypothetical protein [Chitinophaga varians]NLR65685.1 hypothetical protein [Chitinophaga varians]